MESSISGRPEVFVRSLATRERAAPWPVRPGNVARLLEATGSFDVIVIETAGAGQTEAAVAGLVDTVMLVTVPGLGDAVQAIKAGLMELADLVVVNMSDRPGAPETIRHIRSPSGASAAVRQTVATQGEGVAELRAELDQRWERLAGSDELREARLRKQVAEATLVAEEWLRACFADGGVNRPDNLKPAVKQILEEAAKQWQQ